MMLGKSDGLENVKKRIEAKTKELERLKQLNNYLIEEKALDESLKKERDKIQKGVK